ncbi:MAG: DUF1643 domain-containing protein [Pseudomonadota bacterium]
MTDTYDVLRSATFSDDGRYRYVLRRLWNVTQPGVCWIMNNPSVADGEVDDPTVRKCVGFSQRWGKGHLVIVNLFAYVATSPAALVSADRHAVDVVGAGNNEEIRQAIRDATLVVAAWGASVPAPRQVQVVTSAAIASYKTLRCLGVTASGAPRHPGRLGYDTPLVDWPG